MLVYFVCNINKIVVLYHNHCNHFQNLAEEFMSTKLFKIRDGNEPPQLSVTKCIGQKNNDRHYVLDLIGLYYQSEFSTFFSNMSDKLFGVIFYSKFLGVIFQSKLSWQDIISIREIVHHHLQLSYILDFIFSCYLDHLHS